jgi:hypothetical protein
MRRVFVLAGLLAVMLMATWGGPTLVSATQTCTATCSGGSILTCTVATGTCSSASGTVTCCGQAHDCVAVNAYDACRNNCDNQHDACINSCGGHGGNCITNCNTALRTCWNRCGVAPSKSFSC